ncbi:Na/Pi symporter [Rhizobium sp. LjRoot30]|uniref:Na/Pi cotransporter family protein n=1 Tax=Rhizobium sp. LjRoot30 TaxID=3342320 RepID=UPI003ECD4E18
MFLAVAAALGGLGIFFAGMYQLKENLKRLTSRRFKQIVAAWTRRPTAGVVLGIFAGGVMQSTTAVTFILASMIASGLLTVGSALPIITGANVGATLLVMLATLDIHLFVLLVLGITGVSFTFERIASLRTFMSAIFGVGLVLFGLQMLQSGVMPLTSEPWFVSLLSLAGASYFLPLLVSAGLTLIAQSSNSVILLTITLAVAGGLSFEQAMMAIYGCNLGSSCQSLLLSSHLKGRPKQVTMYQVLFNGSTVCLMVLFFFVEQYSEIPLIERLVKAVATPVALQLAFVQLSFNIIGAIVMLSLQPPIRGFLARRFPTLADEDDGVPAFIHHEAIEDPESALDLVRLEQHRLAGYLPQLLETARGGQGKEARASIDRRNSNFSAVSTEIHTFLRQLGDVSFSVSGYDRLNLSINAQRLLDGLNETCVELARTALLSSDHPLSRQLIDNVIEGLDAAMLTMVDAIADQNEEDGALFHAITRNRGDVIQRLRQAYLANDANLSTAQKGTILIVTNLAERAFWLLAQLADQEQPA